MANEWYRTPDWDAAAQADFEARLARARPWGRVQYLNIKAGQLAEAGLLDEAVVLQERSIADPGAVPFHSNGVRESMAQIRIAQGRTDDAILLLRYILENPATGNGTSGATDISLLELLVERRDRSSRDLAKKLIEHRLGMPDDGLPVNVHSFRFAVCMVRHARVLRDRQMRREWAARALQAADAPPVLPRKPFFGVVKADEKTLHWLQRQAR